MGSLGNPPTNRLANIGARPRGKGGMPAACWEARILEVCTVETGALEVGTEEWNEPVLEFLERGRVEAVVPVLRFFTNRNKSVVTQHLEVFGDGGLAEAKLLNYLPDTDLSTVEFGGHVTLQEDLEYVTPGRVSNDVVDVSHSNRVAKRGGEYHGNLIYLPQWPGVRMRGKPISRASLFGRIRDMVDAFAAATPARFAIAIFVGLILVFTLIFSLPISTTSGQAAPLADAVFTAVSVVCVTGLSTVDMATFWSPFGHGMILLGVQIGGVGVLTLASILGLVISRRLGLRQRLLAASDSNPLRTHRGIIPESQAVRLGEIGGLLVTVAISTLIIEVAVALLLLPRILAEGVPILDALWQSFYYSAMAFTNTGFLPTADGLTPYAQDYWFLSVLMLGVFLGAVGFPVIYVLMRNFRRPKRWSVHVKITLATTLLLFVLGGVAFFLLELQNQKTFASLDWGQRVFQPFFLSMMTRSGGFATIDISQLNGSSLLVGDMLMFIGGGSASTAGGIKVTTLAILFLAAFAEARGNEEMEAFDRRIPSDVLRLGVSVVLWGATTVAAASIIILQISGASLDFVLFEVISAFGTSGLSTSLSSQLPDVGIYVLAATMFMGRVGTVTLAAALAASQRRRLFKKAEERPIVG